ncbi:hypothetical protein ACFV2N_33245 [Streptomyces sp. NPDC059680]|uniref:hypothetical protein n=1 Tax=Streptomyces sp. NPDC059680 TaxID=3346904 RepID=UPI0036766BFE
MDSHGLRHRRVGPPTVTATPDMLPAPTSDQLSDALAIRRNGSRSRDTDFTVC